MNNNEVNDEVIANLIAAQQSQAKINEQLVTSLTRLRNRYHELASKVDELEGAIAYLILDDGAKNSSQSHGTDLSAKQAEIDCSFAVIIENLRKLLDEED